MREGHGHWLGVFRAALALAEEEPRPAPGTRGPVTHIFLNGRRSPDPRRLLIRYLLMKCSEHRFKLHVAQQPRETVGLKKKKTEGGETPLCVEGGRPPVPAGPEPAAVSGACRSWTAAVNTSFLR